MEMEPAWSPDGTRIAFARTDGLNKNLYAMDADGTGMIPYLRQEHGA
jgi:Tol biopolymer transport system component